MIYGYIHELKNYRGISTNLDNAIDYILSKKYLNNNVGKNEINGDELYFNCPDKPKTKIQQLEMELEAHKQYIDIHVVIDGTEIIAYSDIENCKIVTDYNEKDDYYLLEGKLENKFVMNKDKFIMFFADEPHLAMLAENESKEIKKVIFKVKIGG